MQAYSVTSQAEGDDGEKVNLYIILLESLEGPQGPMKVFEIPLRDAVA